MGSTGRLPFIRPEERPPVTTLRAWQAPATPRHCSGPQGYTPDELFNVTLGNGSQLKVKAFR